MKKKFDFTAEMNEAQIPLNDPKNDFLEEEKQLLEKNAQRIANLNKNVEILYDSITAGHLVPADFQLFII